MLPVKPLATDIVSVAGESITIRSLSRAEALHMRTIVAADGDAEAYVIAKATSETLEDAATWLDKVDNQTATDLVAAILKLSALVDRNDPNP